MKTYKDILAEAGFPTTAIVLDFETYFTDDYTLKGPKSVSVVEYVMDPRFEVTGLGAGWLGAPGVFISVEDVQRTLTKLQDEWGQNLERLTVVGQNLFFDALILHEHYGITPKYTVDTIDLDRMWDARAPHSLDKMAPRWGLTTPKGDTKQFLGYHVDDMSPDVYEKFVEYTLTDIELESALFQKMMPIVVSRPEVEIPVAAHTLKMFLNTKFKVDMEQGKKLQTRMQLEMARAVSAAGKVLGFDCGHEDISTQVFIPAFTEVLERHGSTMPMKLSDEPHKKTGKRELIPALAKDDLQMQELLAHPVDEIRILAEAKQAVGSWPGHIKRVRKIVAQANARGGMLGTPLKYHSGHTGRWGGGQKINLQNLIEWMRLLLTAHEGYVLGLPDYSSIEARKLAWLAGQTDLLKAFAAGENVYCLFAEALFQQPVHKPDKKTDSPEEYELMTLLYGFGKMCILGYGYGMGGEKSYQNCITNPKLRPYFDSGEYDRAFIDNTVKKYRSQYAMIPKFWREIESAWRFVTRYKDQVKVVGKLTFWAQGSATYITLPSGRDFRYPEARVNSKGELRFKYGKLYGGALAENVTQASSRDLLAEAILRLDDAGFDIALHVHDSAPSLLPKEGAEKLLAKQIEIMNIVPEWAKGLPISTEGELRGFL
jgi:DNA polymerase